MYTVPTIRAAAIGALLAIAGIAATGHAGTAARHFMLVNASYDSVVAIATSTGGTAGYQPLIFDAPLRGGRHAITVEVPGSGCLHDFRVVFRDGRTLHYPGIDVCRSGGLRLTARDGR